MVGQPGGNDVPVDTPTAMAGWKKKSMSWILMDSSGQETVLDVDKYAIMDRVQIHARDLRLLDPLLSYPSTILGRERAIVLNLEHIKALITADEVLICDPLDDKVIPIVEELRRRLKIGSMSRQDNKDDNLDVRNDVDTDSPFEFLALEVALEGICSYLDARATELGMAVYPALNVLTSKISSRNLDRVRKLKSQMTRLTARVQKVKDELEQLLDDDDDMADLYLSRKLSGASPLSGSGSVSRFLESPTIGSKISRISRASVATVHGDENDVDEIEILLELREYTDSTEDYINVQLDSYRNQLIQLDLFLSSGTVCLSIYALVTSIFGMNIPYTWNKNHGYLFKWVVMIMLFGLIVSYARHKGLVGS